MISRPVTLFWQRVNHFFLWTTLYMSSNWQGIFNYQFEIFGLTWNQSQTSQTQSECSTTRLPRWLNHPQHLAWKYYLNQASLNYCRWLTIYIKDKIIKFKFKSSWFYLYPILNLGSINSINTYNIKIEERYVAYSWPIINSISVYINIIKKSKLT